MNTFDFALYSSIRSPRKMLILSLGITTFLATSLISVVVCNKKKPGKNVKKVKNLSIKIGTSGRLG